MKTEVIVTLKYKTVVEAASLKEAEDIVFDAIIHDGVDVSDCIIDEIETYWEDFSY